MNDELIKQIHQNIYNDNMLYSLYNILDDEGYLTQLKSTWIPKEKPKRKSQKRAGKI